jgi:hypothetical protein
MALTTNHLAMVVTGKLFKPRDVGRGNSAEEARDDFCLKFHSLFQDLTYKRPFEMTATDSPVWKKIRSVGDVTDYRNRMPLVAEQYGVVSYGQTSRPCKIKWDNGFTEAVDIRRVTILLSPHRSSTASSEHTFLTIAFKTSSLRRDGLQIVRPSTT